MHALIGAMIDYVGTSVVPSSVMYVKRYPTVGARCRSVILCRCLRSSFRTDSRTQDSGSGGASHPSIVGLEHRPASTCGYSFPPAHSEAKKAAMKTSQDTTPVRSLTPAMPRPSVYNRPPSTYNRLPIGTTTALLPGTSTARELESLVRVQPAPAPPASLP